MRKWLQRSDLQCYNYVCVRIHWINAPVMSQLVSECSEQDSVAILVVEFGSNGFVTNFSSSKDFNSNDRLVRFIKYF